MGIKTFSGTAIDMIEEVFLLYSVLVQYELGQKISTNPQQAYNLLKISYPNNDQVLNQSLVNIQTKFNTFLFFRFLLTQH